MLSSFYVPARSAGAEMPFQCTNGVNTSEVSAENNFSKS